MTITLNQTHMNHGLIEASLCEIQADARFKKMSDEGG